MAVQALNFRRNVLVLEDGDIEWVLMEHFLTKVKPFDISSFRAKNASEALSLLATHNIDLCLFDYYLFGETGVDVVMQMREQKITTPVIMITGLDDDDIQTKITAYGLNDTLNKEHLSVETLSEALSKYLS